MYFKEPRCPPTASRAVLYAALCSLQAILDSIRDLMTTPLVVPEWLHDVLLGYGDPAAAAYWSPLPARLHFRRRRS